MGVPRPSAGSVTWCCTVTSSMRKWLVRRGCTGWVTGSLSTLLYNHRVNELRRLFGLPYRPQTEKLKAAIGTSARFIAKFENVAAAQAREQGYDGVICGHIHRANLCRIEGTFYANTGDWVESCSALVETRAGEMQLMRWPQGTVVSIGLRPLLADAA